MNWFLIIKIVKKTYRQSLINQRNALNVDEIMSLSSKIVTNFFQSPEAIKISTLASYKAINKEVNLDQLSEERSQKFKILTFPVIGANHTMDLVMPDIDSKFKRNKYGILEPCNGKIIELKNHDAIIVPTVGVDKNGYRLGYGGGYYDRFLAPIKTMRNKPKILGLVFNFQLINKAINEDHDIKFDKIYTEDSSLDFF